MTSTHQGTIIIALLGLIAGSCLGMVTMIGANVAEMEMEMEEAVQ